MKKNQLSNDSKLKTKQVLQPLTNVKSSKVLKRVENTEDLFRAKTKSQVKLNSASVNEFTKLVKDETAYEVETAKVNSDELKGEGSTDKTGEQNYGKKVQEKGNKHSSSLYEKKSARVQFKESKRKNESLIEEIKQYDKNLALKDYDGPAQDEVRKLKEMIKEMTKAYKNLEDSFCQDTNDLKREIEKLKNLTKKYETEILSLKNKTEQQTVEIEDLNKKVTLLTSEKEENSKTLEEKENEIYQLTDILTKIKLEKKTRDQNLKDFQMQVLSLTSDNKVLENELNLKKRDLGIALSSLEKHKLELQNFEQQFLEFSKLKKSNTDLQYNNKSVTQHLNFVIQNYSELQRKYNDLKDLLEEKALQEPANNPQVSQRATLRRLTQNPSASQDSQKEILSRLYLKIDLLEESLETQKIENAKLSRDQDYFKKQIQEKNRFISSLEKRLEMPSLDPMQNNFSLAACLSCSNFILKDLQEILSLKFFPNNIILCKHLN